MTFEQILTETTDGIMTITMNRPDRLNAWTPQMCNEMGAAIEAANADPDVLGIVVTGAGRGFCAGADIGDVFQADLQSGNDGSQAADIDWVALVRRSKPMVAAVNGPAIGVGLTQILPMDCIVGARGAKLSVRFIKMGLVPELASSHFLPMRVGFGNASELMLTGKTILAEEAAEIGLVDKLAEPDELLDVAQSAALAMGENPQAALRMVKDLLTENLAEPSLREVQRREVRSLGEAFKTPEHAEAIDAFMNKRDPDFAAARQR